MLLRSAFPARFIAGTHVHYSVKHSLAHHHASMESVMISLWGRQYRIPECPWAIPSHMATVLTQWARRRLPGSPSLPPQPAVLRLMSRTYLIPAVGNGNERLVVQGVDGTPADARWALDMAFWNGSNLSIARNIISSC